MEALIILIPVVQLTGSAYRINQSGVTLTIVFNQAQKCMVVNTNLVTYITTAEVNILVAT